jgi:hypothetical protein
MEKSRTDEFLTRDEARRIAANVAKLLGSLLIPFEILIVRGMVFSAIMPPGWANFSPFRPAGFARVGEMFRQREGGGSLERESFALFHRLAVKSDRISREYDHFRSDRRAIVKVDDVFVAHADAASGHVMPDALRLVGTVNAVERVDLALPQIECPCAERIIGAAMHAVTALQWHHVLADFRFAIEDIARRTPVRPFLLVVHGRDAGPAKAFLADADFVLNGLAAHLHRIEKMIGGIDYDRTRPLARDIGDKLLGRPVVNRLRRLGDAAGKRKRGARYQCNKGAAIRPVILLRQILLEHAHGVPSRPIPPNCRRGVSPNQGEKGRVMTRSENIRRTPSRPTDQRRGLKIQCHDRV